MKQSQEIIIEMCDRMLSQITKETAFPFGEVYDVIVDNLPIITNKQKVYKLACLNLQREVYTLMITELYLKEVGDNLVILGEEGKIAKRLGCHKNYQNSLRDKDKLAWYQTRNAKN